MSKIILVLKYELGNQIETEFICVFSIGYVELSVSVPDAHAVGSAGVITVTSSVFVIIWLSSSLCSLYASRI